MLGGHLDGLVHIPALDQAEPAHLLLGLGERPVGEQQLAAAHPHGPALRRGPPGRAPARPAPRGAAEGRRRLAARRAPASARSTRRSLRPRAPRRSRPPGSAAGIASRLLTAQLRRTNRPGITARRQIAYGPLPQRP